MPPPPNKAELSYEVTFSEPVLGVETDPVDTFNDFVLTPGGGVTGAVISSVTGGGAVYTVRVDTGTGDGTLRLDVAAAGGARDAVGNRARRGLQRRPRIHASAPAFPDPICRRLSRPSKRTK